MDYVSEIVSVRGACVRCWDIPGLWPWPRMIVGTRLQGALSENRKMPNKTGRVLVWMNAGMTVVVQEIWKSCFLHPSDQTWRARQSRNSSEKEIMLSSLAHTGGMTHVPLCLAGKSHCCASCYINSNFWCKHTNVRDLLFEVNISLWAPRGRVESFSILL